MNKSVYSLVLMDNVVSEVDKLAYELGTSRSNLSNQILAEYVRYTTPEMRMRAIFDEMGDLVANAPHVPVHLGSMSDSVKPIMRLNPNARPGDAYMLNSPYNGGTHLPDVTVITPVFDAGRPVLWLGSRGHHADIGGRTRDPPIHQGAYQVLEGNREGREQ